MASLTQVGGFLNLAHAVGACACHGGAMISQAAGLGSGGLALPGFHLHADGTMHADDEHAHQSIPLFKPTSHSKPSQSLLASRHKTSPPAALIKLFDLDSRGLSHLFEPSYTSQNLSQLFLAA